MIKVSSVFSSVELIGGTGEIPAEGRQVVQKGKTVVVPCSNKTLPTTVGPEANPRPSSFITGSGPPTQTPDHQVSF